MKTDVLKCFLYGDEHPLPGNWTDTENGFQILKILDRARGLFVGDGAGMRMRGGNMEL